MKKTKTIQQLLKGIDRDFDTTDSKYIKMIRHADTRTISNNNNRELLIFGKSFPSSMVSIRSLYIFNKELFLQYQSEQKASNVKDIKYLVSFIGEKGNKARFIGVFKIIGKTPSPYTKDEVILELQQIKTFEDYENRIIVDWMTPASSWIQYYDKEKLIVDEEEVLENNAPNFESYLDVQLNYYELCDALKHPDWVPKLKENNCIYAILDNLNGKLYVGSTYNSDGIFGRWSEYAITGHGKNTELEKKGSAYCINNFKWCILEILPLNISEAEAISRENKWKEKLGTRKFGNYNKN